jgi:[ribosomal protein S5]-alanine N-acetyltransferase
VGQKNIAAFNPAPETELLQFIERHGIKVLNVGGPRASNEPEVAAFVTPVLTAALSSRKQDQPTLRTVRLVLRAWDTSNAAALQRLVGRREIADTMISVPHPFTQEYAEKWIASHGEAFAKGEAVHFAIILAETGSVVGAVELRAINVEHGHAEMSCWIGVEWWGQGFATEAALAVIRFAFEQLQLNRLVAFHMVRNPASGRALERIGMKREGLLRQCVSK